VTSNLLDQGEDLAMVADVLRHSSIQTTKSYDRRGDQRKKRAAGKLRLS
jgi:site-specific recombinase XerD